MSAILLFHRKWELSDSRRRNGDCHLTVEESVPWRRHCSV